MRLRKRSASGALLTMPGISCWLWQEAGDSTENCLGGVLPGTPSADENLPDESTIRQLVRKYPGRWNVLAPIPSRVQVVVGKGLSAEELSGGMRWQSEKLFRMSDLAPVYDHENLPPQADLPPQALAIALKQSLLQRWNAWCHAIDPPPHGLEPVFTAAIRGLHIVVNQVPHVVSSQSAGGPSNADQGASVFLLERSAGGGIAIFLGKQLLFARSLIQESEFSSPLSSGINPQEKLFTCEAGQARMLESILYVEDRFPRLQFSNLITIGEFEEDALASLSRRARLPLSPTPAPPAGIPAQLYKSGAWLPLLGGLKRGDF